MANRNRKVFLEEAAKEKQRGQLLDQIEVSEDRPGLSLNIDPKSFELRLHIRISRSKFSAWFGGLTAVAAALATLLKLFLPLLIAYFHKLLP